VVCDARRAAGEVAGPPVGGVHRHRPRPGPPRRRRTRGRRERPDRGATDDHYVGVGGYVSSAQASVAAPDYAELLCGAYEVPAFYARVVGAFTTPTPVDAYRGTGRPEATYLIERAIRRAAAELDVDPAELRRRNSHLPGGVPLRRRPREVHVRRRRLRARARPGAGTGRLRLVSRAPRRSLAVDDRLGGAGLYALGTALIPFAAGGAGRAGGVVLAVAGQSVTVGAAWL